MFPIPEVQVLSQPSLGCCTGNHGRGRWTCFQLHSMAQHIQGGCKLHWYHMLPVFCHSPQQDRWGLPARHLHVKHLQWIIATKWAFWNHNFQTLQHAFLLFPCKDQGLECLVLPLTLVSRFYHQGHESWAIQMQ